MITQQQELLTEPQVASNDVWSYISPSRLNLWLKCPLAFKLRYVDGVSSPPGPSLFLGKQVHEGLEIFYRHRQMNVALDAGQVCLRLLDHWDQAVTEEQMGFANLDEERKLKEKAVDLVTTYVNQLPSNEPKPIAVETRLSAPLVDPTTNEDLGINLLGIVDLVLPDDDGPVVCDFKTAAKSSAPAEITHEVQLSCYAYMFRSLNQQQEGGLEIRSLIKTKTPKIETHRFEQRTEAHFRRLFTVIRAYLDDLHSGRFMYRPGWTCSMCEHRDSHCRQWRP